MSKLPPIRVTFFGDSICVGQGVSIYQGWVTRIAKDLDDYGTEIGRGILVTNASFNGRTTRQALEDMPYSVQSHGVDICLVQFGLNDCNHWLTDKGLPRVSRGAFSENLREIVSRAIHFGAFRIMLNTNHPTDLDREVMPGAVITYEASNRNYNEAIRALAPELDPRVRLQDIEDCFRRRIAAGTPIETLLLPDGLHLSEQGHRLYFDLVRPAIRAAVCEFAEHQRENAAR
ncbi:MAG: SGNH/GDSL hydrolase family protein [Woeseiaceae bacterium]